MTDGWLVSIRGLGNPGPADASSYDRDEADRLLRVWHQHVGETGHARSDDFEYFFEDAARLDAAITTFGPDRVWLTTYRAVARNLGTGEERPVAELEQLPRYGLQPKHLDHHPAFSHERQSDRYASLTAFQSHAGRRLHLTGTGLVSGPDLADRALELAELDPGRRVVVKVNQPKAGLFRLIIPAGADRGAVEDLLFAELDWSLVRLEGLPAAFLAQQWVPMRYEYRTFVVGGVPVTGAGCIEEHTPLNRAGEFDFDPLVREHRTAEGSVEHRPDLADTYRGFAAMVAEAVAAEQPELDRYVLDVALGADDRPLVVELNGLLNSGLYASNPRRVTEALDRLTPR